MINKYSLYRYQVSGKAPKLVTNDNKIILKCYLELQQLFYQYFHFISNTHQHYQLKKYLPQYYGIINLNSKPMIQYCKQGENKQISIWLEHVKMRYDKKNQQNKFLLLGNFLYSFVKPNVLDIKIGGRQEKPKKITKTVEQYKMKLNGMLKTSQDDTCQFISKYHLNQITEYTQIIRYIAYFFSINGKLQIHILNTIIQQLQELVLVVRTVRGWKFISTSICMIYDTQQSYKCQVKFIDFARARLNQFQQQYDIDTSLGIEYVIMMIKEILRERQQYENIKIDKKQNKDVVPLSKVKKFQIGSDRQWLDNTNSVIANGQNKVKQKLFL